MSRPGNILWWRWVLGRNGSGQGGEYVSTLWAKQVEAGVARRRWKTFELLSSSMRDESAWAKVGDLMSSGIWYHFRSDATLTQEGVSFSWLRCLVSVCLFLMSKSYQILKSHITTASLQRTVLSLFSDEICQLRSMISFPEQSLSCLKQIAPFNSRTGWLVPCLFCADCYHEFHGGLLVHYDRWIDTQLCP